LQRERDNLNISLNCSSQKFTKFAINYINPHSNRVVFPIANQLSAFQYLISIITNIYPKSHVKSYLKHTDFPIFDKLSIFHHLTSTITKIITNFPTRSINMKDLLKLGLTALLALVLAGCGSSGSSSDSGGNTPKYIITFLNTNLDIINSTIKPSGNVNITAIADEFGITSAYRANDITNIAGDATYEDYNLTENINFYNTSNFDVTEIRTQEELNNTRINLSGTYILLNDIELKAKSADGTREAGFEDGNGWLPIGDPTDRFEGIFSGGSHKITNLWSLRAGGNVGLFGYIDNNAAIKNIGVEIGSYNIVGLYYVGAIAGYVESGSITNSYSKGNVSGYEYVGGIAGLVESGSITNSYSTGAIVGENFVGGIVGRLQGNGASITNSYTTGDISGADFVGGIIGDTRGTSFITNSYANGDVIGIADYVGGIAGYVQNCSITNSYSKGNVSGHDFVGGIAGAIIGGTIQNNAAINPSVTGDYLVNRIVGNKGGGTVSNNFAYKLMTLSGDTVFGKDGTDKDSDTLKEQDTYSNATSNGGLGWKFGNDDLSPWQIGGGKNSGYPYLYFQD
jgi:hypothetical protein